MAEILLSAENLSVGYGKPLFSMERLNFAAGEFVCLVGPNGSGKSSLFRTLSGLVPALSGKVALCGLPLLSIPARRRAQLLAGVFTLVSVPRGLSVQEFVSLGRIPYSGFLDSRTAEDEAAVRDALRDAGVETLSCRELCTLSDGERARAFLARALAGRSKVLLLDEPSAFLDVPHTLALFRLLRTLARERNAAVIASTHNIDYACRFADKLLALDGMGGAFSGSVAETIRGGYLNWAEVNNEKE